MGHHGYTLGAQDVDGGWLQLDGISPTVPTGLGKGMGHNRDAFLVAATRDGLARSVVGSQQYDDDTNTFLLGAPSDPHGMRAPDGLAGRAHHRGVAATLNGGGNDGGNDGGFRTEPGEHLVYVKAGRAQSAEDDESWKEGDVMPTLNSFDVGDARTTAAILGAAPSDDPLLPLGLDSNRYRCCGNGVVSSVAEWIGLRLAALA